jgi:hypothetical protein
MSLDHHSLIHAYPVLEQNAELPLPFAIAVQPYAMFREGALCRGKHCSPFHTERLGRDTCEDCPVTQRRIRHITMMDMVLTSHISISLAAFSLTPDMNCFSTKCDLLNNRIGMV